MYGLKHVLVSDPAWIWIVWVVGSIYVAALGLLHFILMQWLHIVVCLRRDCTSASKLQSTVQAIRPTVRHGHLRRLEHSYISDIVL